MTCQKSSSCRKPRAPSRLTLYGCFDRGRIFHDACWLSPIAEQVGLISWSPTLPADMHDGAGLYRRGCSALTLVGPPISSMLLMSDSRASRSAPCAGSVTGVTGSSRRPNAVAASLNI